MNCGNKTTVFFTELIFPSENLSRRIKEKCQERYSEGKVSLIKRTDIPAFNLSERENYIKIQLDLTKCINLPKNTATY